MSDAPRSRDFLEPGAAAGRDEAKVAIVPVPFEGTVSYGRGASAGPDAILAASEQLELYDEQLGSEPFRCGVWTDRPVDVEGAGACEVVDRVEQRMDELARAGKWTIMLGGEHSITVGAVRSAVGRHGDLQVVQLDAHADLRDSYQGSRWSHACAMARCLELAPVRAIGVRSYSAAEAERIAGGIDGYDLIHARQMGSPGWIDRALSGLDGRPVYLTVDVDFFDPGVVPSTGTPEPGGGDWWGTLDLLERLFGRGPVVGCDVVELAPHPGRHHADFTVARLVYKLVGLFAAHGGDPGRI